MDESVTEPATARDHRPRSAPQPLRLRGQLDSGHEVRVRAQVEHVEL